ncbi:MAG: DNA polymerase III subunit alpha [Elusimicrobia bacterium]|nr:MAG: DNA polymerase III subunit alpha [Elusimicrobiota bacterium]
MASKPEFVHLHNHSEYSLMDGTTRWSDHSGKAPSPLLERLAHEGARAIACTDHGNLYGAIEFYTRCRKVGIKPIIGCEMYLAKKSRFDRGGSQKENCHITVLARNLEGYQNLMALSSKAFLEGYYYDPRIDKDLLAEHSKGIIVLSGCLKSELNQMIASGDLQSATQLAMDYRDILEPGQFYLEIMDHGLEMQRTALKALLEINKKTKIPLIATNDCHYVGKNDYVAHDARVCISTGKKLAETNRLRFESHEFYYKSAAEMMKIFHFAPEAVTNTVEIAEKCNLEIPMGESILPTFPLPENYTQDSYLEKLCREGLKELGFNESGAYLKRLEYELGIITRMGYSGYFLIVWDFILWAKKQNIPVGPGRGSGAGALVCYTLGITAVDPIEHDLLFERFLNPDRVSMPDLDIDFSDEGRPRVIEYVRDKYGHDNVAQIITFGSLKARLAIRDVGRVMDVPLSEVDKLAKLIPLGHTLNQAMEGVPELQQAASDPQTKKLLELAKKLEGLKRHTGVHAAGIVITKEAVVKYTPLAKSPKSDVITTQYDGDWLPELGLLKMDFLGLRNLTIIDDAVKLIRNRHDPDFDIAKIPSGDKKTYALLQSGKALGVFQLDSEGMRELLRRLKPTTFEDISACIALYRPGPMSSGMLDLFVERKHGKKVRYDHKLMEPILKDTYGCMVYQEQVMAIAKSLAGFTPGEADVLRKAMGKKVPEVMEKLRSQFVDGCKKKKIADKLATKVFEQILKFGGYGFNKSHTVAYGTLSYQTGYLKANYPIEYYTALLTSEIGKSAVSVEGKENKLVSYLEDAKSAGFTIGGPCVNKSFEKFAIEDEKDGPVIRFGLTAVKSVGQGAAESIVEARGSDGPFKSLDDFCRRVNLKAANKKCLESLIMAGGMDALMAGLSIEEARARLMTTLEATVGRQSRIKADLEKGQGLLFGTDLPVARAGGDESSEKIEPWHEHDLLKHERSVLGFYLSGHPLVRYQDMLGCVSSHPIEELTALGEDAPKQIRLAGMISSIKKIITRKGDPMARGVLEDLTGEITMLVFPKAYASGLGQQMKSNAIVSVSGRLSFPTNFRGDDDIKPAPELIVEEIMPIDMAINRYARALTLQFSTIGLEENLLVDLKRILRKHPGRIPVFIQLDTPSHGQTLVETEERVVLKDGLFDQLEKVLGDKAWKIESVS